MTEHPQIEIEGVEVDVGLSVLLQLVWKHGLSTRESCQGGGITAETAMAYIIFSDVADAAEFLLHCAHTTDYRLGDRIALTLQHPLEDITTSPEGKVTWMPELTPVLVKKW